MPYNAVLDVAPVLPEVLDQPQQSQTVLCGVPCCAQWTSRWQALLQSLRSKCSKAQFAPFPECNVHHKLGLDVWHQPLFAYHWPLWRFRKLLLAAMDDKVRAVQGARCSICCPASRLVCLQSAHRKGKLIYYIIILYIIIIILCIIIF